MKSQPPVLTDVQHRLLVDALRLAGYSADEHTFDAKRFRAQHHEHLAVINDLVERGMISGSPSDRYEIRLAALPLLNDGEAHALLKDLARLHDVARDLYLDTLDAPISVADLAKRIHVTPERAHRLLQFAQEARGIGAPHGKPNSKQLVQPSESILEHKTFEDRLQWWMSVAHGTPQSLGPWEPARRLARQLWAQNPSLTKKAVATAIKERDDHARHYELSTIDGHIKDCNPNRKPGRRPHKKGQ